MLTRGMDKPMRGRHMVISHWPMMVMVMKNYGVKGG
jgi:hypothetical protein